MRMNRSRQIIRVSHTRRIEVVLIDAFVGPWWCYVFFFKNVARFGNRWKMAREIKGKELVKCILEELVKRIGSVVGSFADVRDRAQWRRPKDST
jgi:uncharacterized protein (DUF2235 family)